MQFYISLQPLIALIAGILILLIPRLLNYVGPLFDHHWDSWADENVENKGMKAPGNLMGTSWRVVKRARREGG